MDRRQFLKALGLTATALALPIGLLEFYPDFVPTKQYGNYTIITDFLNRKELKQVTECFYDEIKKSIPKQYRKNIKWLVVQPGEGGPSTADPLNCLGWVGWKYTHTRL